jgi:hypothetical protein
MIAAKRFECRVHRYLDLSDDGERILLVTDFGGDEDHETRVIRDIEELPERFHAEYLRLERERVEPL